MKLNLHFSGFPQGTLSKKRDFSRGQKNPLLFEKKLGDGDDNNHCYLLFIDPFSVCNLFYKHYLLLILKMP